MVAEPSATGGEGSGVSEDSGAWRAFVAGNDGAGRAMRRAVNRGSRREFASFYYRCKYISSRSSLTCMCVVIPCLRPLFRLWLAKRMTGWLDAVFLLLLLSDCGRLDYSHKRTVRLKALASATTVLRHHAARYRIPTEEEHAASTKSKMREH